MQKLMQKKRFCYIVICLFLINLFCSLPFLSNKLNLFDDIAFHLTRITNLADAFREGNFLPFVYSTTLDGYGYGNGIFYPHIFLYIPALMVFFGMKLGLSYRIFLILITIATSITAFISAKGILKILKVKRDDNLRELCVTHTDKVALLITVLYVLNPYRTIDVLLRSALGEILALIFIPIVIWGIFEVFYSEENNWHILTIGMVGILYSHIITLLIMSALVFFFMIINIENILEYFSKLFKATLMSFLLGSGYLFGYLEQINYNTFYFDVKKPFGEIYEHSFNIIPELNIYLLLAINIFVIYLLILFIERHSKIELNEDSVLNINNERKIEYFKRLFIAITICAIIMTTNIFPWKLFSNFSLVSKIQFCWRILIVSTFIISIAYGITTKKIETKKNILFNKQVLIGTTIGALSIIYLIFSVGCYVLDGGLLIDEDVNYDYIGKGEYLPEKLSLDYIKEKGNTVSEIRNKEFEYEYTKEGNTYNLKFSSDANYLDLELPLVYYYGYRAHYGKYELECYESDNGLVAIDTKHFDSGTITIKYEPTFMQASGIGISCISFIFFIYYIHDKSKVDKTVKELEKLSAKRKLKSIHEKNR